MGHCCTSARAPGSANAALAAVSARATGSHSVLLLFLLYEAPIRWALLDGVAAMHGALADCGGLRRRVHAAAALAWVLGGQVVPRAGVGAVVLAAGALQQAQLGSRGACLQAAGPLPW